MATAVLERENIRAVSYKLPSCGFDDEPLSDSEIAQMADKHIEPNMRSTWEEIWQKHAALS